MRSHDNGPKTTGSNIHAKAAAVCLRRSGGTSSGANLILNKDGLRLRSRTILQERKDDLEDVSRSNSNSRRGLVPQTGGPDGIAEIGKDLCPKKD